MFPHLCVQNNDDACPTYATGVAAGARVYRERRRAVGRWWWRALIIPRHAIAIRKLPNQPRVWLGRQWCSIIRFVCRTPYTHTHTQLHTYVPRTQIHRTSAHSRAYKHFGQSKSWYAVGVYRVYPRLLLLFKLRIP